MSQLHIITCNPLVGKSIKEYIDNFLICHLTTKLMVPYTEPQYVFTIYHQDGMELEEFEEYISEPGYQYNFVPCEGITTALDMIAEDIMNDEVDLELDKEDSDDNPDELILTVVTQTPAFNRQFSTYLNRIFRENESEVKALDFYQYMKITNIQHIENVIKSQLQTEYVYPEDPVSFAYCLEKIMNGVVT